MANTGSIGIVPSHFLLRKHVFGIGPSSTNFKKKVSQRELNFLFLFCSKETVMQPLLEALNQTGFETTFEEVAQTVGITEVNNCEIYNSDGLTGLRGLFPVTSLMSHK